jgi:hypothetical protein
MISPLFRFKLNFMDSFGTAMNKDRDRFLYLRNEFQRTGEEKIKENISIIVIFMN